MIGLEGSRIQDSTRSCWATQLKKDVKAGRAMTFASEYEDRAIAMLDTADLEILLEEAVDMSAMATLDAADLKLLLAENMDVGAMSSMERQDQEEEDEQEAYDDVKGGLLDIALVRRARQLELEYLWNHDVYGYASRHRALARGKKPIRLKWLDTNKGDSSCPNLRSHLVAMEIRRKGVEAIFSATPPLESLRALLRIAAQEEPGGKDPVRLYIADVSRAHFYASAQREVYIELPKEDPLSKDPDAVGLLGKTMYGTLDADGLPITAADWWTEASSKGKPAHATSIILR